jgi:hypothetical protein
MLVVDPAVDEYRMEEKNWPALAARVTLRLARVK